MARYENVVLLSIDALRKDRVNGDYIRDVAPFLSKLAEDNTEFSNCISTSSHTREAMSSMLTGVYPYRANTRGLIPSKAPGGGFNLDRETISSYIDVRTGAFHSNPFLSRSFGYGDSWDRFDDDLSLGNSKVMTLLNRFLDKLLNRHYSSAEEINQKSLDWLDSGKGRFLLWNHYMDPHGPYQPPKGSRGKYQDKPLSNRKSQKLLKRAIENPESISDTERQRLIDLYDEEISYTDRKIEEFFEQLEERDLLENTLVIIAGDHGEAFGEEGFYEHGEALNEELVRVPLILVDGRDRTVETPVSLVDIVPTILEALGEEKPEDLDGESLLEVAEDPEDFSGRTVFTQDTKDEHLLFGGFNGGELQTIEGDDGDLKPSGHEGLERELREYARKALDREEESSEDEEMEEEVKERLEALGYMGEKSR
ncbi:MAG: sulfatase [Candidatus Nanosalina sp.]